MENVTYEKELIRPSHGELIFQNTGEDIVSETITLTFKIRLADFANKPIQSIRMNFDMLYPAYYEFYDLRSSYESNGQRSSYDIYFKDVFEDFLTKEIEINIKAVDPSNEFERRVSFKVTVMDEEQGRPFPLWGEYGDYDWEPVLS